MKHTYEHYKNSEGITKKHHKKIIIFTIFLLIVFLLVYFAFFKGSSNSIIGWIARESNGTQNSVQISVDLTLPSALSIEGNIDRIEIKTEGSNNFLYIEKNKFDLAKLEKIDIIINNYNGKISFDAEKILELDGKAAEVLVNGVSIIPQSGSSMKVYFDDNFMYEYLKINNVFIDSLSYTTSGIIKTNQGKMIINIDNEDIKIKKFQGDLEVEKNHFKLDGYADKLNVLGTLDISAT